MKRAEYIAAVVILAGGITATVVFDRSGKGVKANAVMTCSVRHRPDGGSSRYDRVTFPIARTELPDGGLDVRVAASLFAVPTPDGGLRTPAEGRGGFDSRYLVMDWATCTTAPCPALGCPDILTAEPAVASGPSPWAIPNCFVDGGWVDEHPGVDCLGIGPYAGRDGGPVWRGCNVLPREYLTGTECLDSPSNVTVAGDSIVKSLAPRR